MADRFLAGMMPLDEQRSLLDANRIQYVIFSPADWQPADPQNQNALLPELNLIYNQAGYRIYRYQKDAIG